MRIFANYFWHKNFPKKWDWRWTWRKWSQLLWQLLLQDMIFQFLEAHTEEKLAMVFACLYPQLKITFISTENFSLWFMPTSIELRDHMILRLQRFQIRQHISKPSPKEKNQNWSADWTAVTVTPLPCYHDCQLEGNRTMSAVITLWESLMKC
jgi:hypothetical protein